YNGDPHSSPNIVFAPLFPIAVWLASWIPGLDEVSAGFALNKVFFYLALWILFLYLRTFIGQRKTFLTLTALATTAGAYAFHAYYSESAMLLCLSLILYMHRTQRWTWLALASAALGAARVSALPICIVVAGFFIVRRQMISAAVSLLGIFAFLG